ncbi:MAG TPA: hypothetical protein VK843_19405 [Planctomycetota bacterium]|nr:hypothetical protein [Planctomycetota bacterium]
MSVFGTFSRRVVDKENFVARGLFASATIRAAALWVFSVVLIKLVKGSPSDLPVMVRDFLGSMDLGLKFQLVIAIELSIVFIAFLRPRWGWPLLTALFTLFIAMLVTMIAQGATSCGCFGGAIKIKPGTMMFIDAVCLMLMLTNRPWIYLPAKPVRWGLLIPALAVAWIAPFLAFKNEKLPVVPAVVAPGQAWHLPEKLPEFQVLNPDDPNDRNPSWIGKPLRETTLGAYLDVDTLPQDATWILYRITCEHCAKEFLDIAADPERAAKLYVLIHIPEDNEENARQVHQYPPIMMEASLPPLPRGYMVQTPWVLEVEGGVVKSAKLVVE